MVTPRKQPDTAEKKKLKGDSNVEAMLFGLDARATSPGVVLLIGRASYEVGDPGFQAKMREELKEEEKIDSETGRKMLTEDVDIYCSEGIDEVVDNGYKGSYLSLLSKCYVHALNEQTLHLPRGWEERSLPIPLATENLQFKRLHPLDFIIAKGAAGRPKDHLFLSAFVKLKEITREEVAQAVSSYLDDPPDVSGKDLTSAQNLRKLVKSIYPDTLLGRLTEQKENARNQTPHFPSVETTDRNLGGR